MFLSKWDKLMKGGVMRHAAVLGAFFLALFCASSTDGRARDPVAEMDEYIVRAQKDWDVPGLAVAVVHDGELVLAKGYGVRELGTHGTVDEHTLFSIGSTTKAMTAATLGLLVDEGKIGWNDQVTDHWPGFRLRDPYVTREVTVLDLLTHRAGLGNADLLWYGSDRSRDEILAQIHLIGPPTRCAGDSSIRTSCTSRLASSQPASPERPGRSS